MARERFVHYLDLAVYYGFHFLVFSIPLAFLPLIATDSFELIKVTILRIVVIFILSCWLIKQLLSEKIFIRRTKLDLPILIFLIIVSFSTFNSIHLPTSILGKYWRYEGLLTLISYALIFFLAIQTFSDARKIQALTQTIILAAIPITIYGLFQYLGYDFVRWTEVFEVNRSSATFGNPVFLAGYLILILPLILSRYFESTKPYQLLFHGGAFLLALVSTITTFSRGGWLAALVGLIAFSLFLGRRLLFSKKTAFLALALILLFLAVLTINYQQVSSLPEKSLSLSERVSSLTRMGEGSIYSRLLIWQSALKVIKSRPLLGWGPDTFHLVYPTFESLKYLQANIAGRPDNTHNYFLQLAATIGILGLLAFLFILISLFRQRRSALSPEDNHLLYFALVSGVIGYLTHLISGINVVGSGTIFWLFLSLIAIPGSNLRTYQLKINFLPRLIAIFLILILVLIGVSFALRLLLADIHFNRAEELKAYNHFVPALEEYHSAVQLNPYADVYRSSLGILFALQSRKTGSRDFFEKAIATYLGLQKTNPSKTDTYYLLGSLYLYVGREFSPAYYSLAENQLRKALERRPFWAEAHHDLGVSYFETDRFKEAVFQFQAVLEINQRDKESHLFLGKSYEALGNFPKARQAYQSVLKLEPTNGEAREGLKRTEVEERRSKGEGRKI